MRGEFKLYKTASPLARRIPHHLDQKATHLLSERNPLSGFFYHIQISKRHHHSTLREFSAQYNSVKVTES